MSGDTDSRRALRLEQREINDALLANRDKLSETGGSELLARLRAQNDAVFRRVDHTREQLNDVLNLREIALASTVQSERLCESNFGYEFDSFAIALRRRYVEESNLSGTFDWAHLGSSVSALFCGAPVFTTLRGGLMKPVKVRAAIKRAANDFSEIVKPIHVAHDSAVKERGDKHVEATNERVNFLFNHFHQRSQESRVDLLGLLIDSEDPVQTVENFFDFGFLVKTKRVAMQMVDGKPLCTETDPEAIAQHRSSQVILSLDMRDLRDLKDKQLMADHACSLHRVDPLYAAGTALDQAKIIEDRDTIARSASQRPNDSNNKNVDTSSNVLSKKKRPRAVNATYQIDETDGDLSDRKKRKGI